MKTILFLLIVIGCSHSPKKDKAATRAEEQLPRVMMEGITVEKHTFCELHGAYNLLRNTKEATVALWVKPSEVSDNYQHLVNLSVGGKQEAWKSRASFLITPKGELQSAARALDHEDKSEVTTVPGVVTAGEWQHITLTINYAKKKMQFFVNGESVATAAESYKFMTSETADTPSNRSSLGAEDDGSGGYYSGELTQLHIERKILSQDEIKKLMENTRP